RCGVTAKAFTKRRARRVAGPSLDDARRASKRRRGYALAMSPKKCSFRNVPAPVPLSSQWRNSRVSFCLAWEPHLNLHFGLFDKHENVAVGPKNAWMKSDWWQGDAQVPVGLNVPPVTVPLM